VPTIELKYTWEAFDRDARLLAERICLLPGDALAILKARKDGGLYLGKMIEEIKGVEAYCINCQLEESEGEPVIKLVNPPPGLSKRRVFVITERANSGLWLYTVKEYLEEEMGCTVIIVTIHFCEGSIVEPDIYLSKVPKKVHLQYQWEHEHGLESG
jgi:hypothetical protein